MKQVTIWFDRALNLHTENVCCENSFALSRFKKGDTNVLFKASATIDGNVLLLTHTHVTHAGACAVYCGTSSSATARKYFFKKYLRTIEEKIKTHVKGKNYRNNVDFRIRVGITTSDLFDELGYKHVTTTTEGWNTYWVMSRLI